MRLAGQHEQAQGRPLPHDELVCLQRCAQEARVTADLAGQGDGLARAACRKITERATSRNELLTDDQVALRLRVALCLLLR